MLLFAITSVSPEEKSGKKGRKVSEEKNLDKEETEDHRMIGVKLACTDCSLSNKIPY